MKREWALPVILGLLAAAALWTVPHGPQGPKGDGSGMEPTSSSSTGTAGPATPALLLPFERGNAVTGENLTFLVLAPQGKAAALEVINKTIARRDLGNLAWQGDALALYTRESEGSCGKNSTPTGCVEPHWAHDSWALPKAYGVLNTTRPLLGMDGYNATRITVHVFDENGLLAATNADANETARLSGKAHPQQLPGGVWYVGANATAPNGTQPVPAMARPLFEQLKPVMRGLPVGGVASVRSDAYAAVYGPLYVTVRIDGLEWAP